MLTVSSTSLPFTTKPLAVSRCPLTDMFPGFRPPDGGVLVTPAISTAFGCCELEGITPGCNASRSVKLRPFSGTDRVVVPESVSPDCVLAGSGAPPSAVTVRASFWRSSWSVMSRFSAPPANSSAVRW